MSSVDDTSHEFDDLSAGVRVALGAETLRRIGTAMYCIGGVGIVAWALQTYSTWDTVSSEGFAGRSSQKLALVLGSFGTLLLAALVIGAGGACRLLADWTTFRLAIEDVEDFGNDVTSEEPTVD
jgi:hypothetical protein